VAWSEGLWTATLGPEERGNAQSTESSSSEAAELCDPVGRIPGAQHRRKSDAKPCFRIALARNSSAAKQRIRKDGATTNVAWEGTVGDLLVHQRKSKGGFWGYFICKGFDKQIQQSEHSVIVGEQNDHGWTGRAAREKGEKGTAEGSRFK